MGKVAAQLQQQLLFCRPSCFEGGEDKREEELPKYPWPCGSREGDRHCKSRAEQGTHIPRNENPA